MLDIPFKCGNFISIAMARKVDGFFFSAAKARRKLECEHEIKLVEIISYFNMGRISARMKSWLFAGKKWFYCQLTEKSWFCRVSTSLSQKRFFFSFYFFFSHRPLLFWVLSILHRILRMWIICSPRRLQFNRVACDVVDGLQNIMAV